MKTLITIFIVFFSLTTFGQDNSIQTKATSGFILDSLTNEPIAFANIYTDKTTTTTSDLDGKFILQPTQDTISVLIASAVGYEKKTVTTFLDGRPLTIKLKSVPLNPESEFIIWGKAIDTSYYKSGKIEKIKYQGRDEVGFYETGQKKYQSVNGSYRDWYENGNLKSQSILKFNHHRTETEWYDNGTIKAQGTMYWGHNSKTNAGDWFKNNDWKYWDKNGNEI
ncbi:MAG TPA: carboxypeptidase-like regulatory domain-containing protein, partial [Flavobacteriales bacterium]|nr:carboxypeptidase-like regulatory domain-containing protein [Flavobacteriales bacterium]